MSFCQAESRFSLIAFKYFRDLDLLPLFKVKRDKRIYKIMSFLVLVWSLK